MVVVVVLYNVFIRLFIHALGINRRHRRWHCHSFLFECIQTDAVRGTSVSSNSYAADIYALLNSRRKRRNGLWQVSFEKNELGKNVSVSKILEGFLQSRKLFTRQENRIAPSLDPSSARYRTQSQPPTFTMPPKKTPTKKAAPKATKKITKKPAKSPKKKVAKEDKPKRAPGPYMLFCKAERPKIVAANPKFTFGEVGKELGAKWRGMSDAQKAKFK